MPNANDITRDQWLKEMFPEWGTWLIEDIDTTTVRPGTFAMWWLGCTGIWLKSEGGCNIAIDMFAGRGKYSREMPSQGPDFPLNRIAATESLMQNPRNIPHVIDPFMISTIDALLATHNHNDHMDPYSAAAVLKHSGVPFIGPRLAVEKWRNWGVPEDRLITVVPGQSIRIKDVEIIAVDSFDRSALMTVPPEGDLTGIIPDMDERAVNYVVKTPGGTFYHGGDSHFSNYFLRHGKQYAIDVAIASFGENPPGLTDKMTASDVLRMAENLQCKVIIPVHYDIWCNFYADPGEIELLYDYKKHRLNYLFKPYIWQVGGKFVYPDDKDKRQYMYPRGFEDAMEKEPNLPYRSFL